MDTDLLAELHLSGGYQSPLTPAVAARILAWERVCTRRGYRGYVTRPVALRAKEGAFGIYGGAYFAPQDRPWLFRVRDEHERD